MLSRFERMMIRRYLLPGIGGRIVLLVAAIGMAGVTIGVASLILVMSVMNGAQARLVTQIGSIDGHAAITRPGRFVTNWRGLAEAAARQPGVVSATPALAQPAMVSVHGRAFAADLQGLPADALRRNALFQPGTLIAGLAPLRDGDVTIGSGVARRLGVMPGEPVALMLVRFDKDGALTPRFNDFRVSGIFETGDSRYDDRRIVGTMAAVQAMVARGDVASRIDVVTQDADRASAILAPLKARLASFASLRTWREMNKALFDALAVEHVAMFLVLSLVVLVALFNIMSSLVMLVRSRRREIAILRTMGATRASVVRIFVAIGASIGGAGTLLGVALGLALVFAKAPLSDWARDRLLAPIGPSAFGVFLDMPFVIGPGEVAGIAAMTLAGTLLATLYPSWRAAAIDPAQVLRYE